MSFYGGTPERTSPERTSDVEGDFFLLALFPAGLPALFGMSAPPLGRPIACSQNPSAMMARGCLVKPLVGLSPMQIFRNKASIQEVIEARMRPHHFPSGDGQFIGGVFYSLYAIRLRQLTWDGADDGIERH